VDITSNNFYKCTATFQTPCSLLTQTRSQSNSNLIHSTSLSLKLSFSFLRAVWRNRTLLH